MRPGARDEVRGLLRREAARVGDALHVGAVLFETAEPRLGRDVNDHDLAAFFGRTDHGGLHAAGQRRLERAIPLLLVGPVGELLLRADVIAEHVLRRRHACPSRQVAHQRRRELRLRGRTCDERRKVGIVGRGRRGAALRRDRRGGNRERHRGEPQPAWRTPAVHGAPNHTTGGYAYGFPPSARDTSAIARCARTLFPAASSGGEMAAIPNLPGDTAMSPPPTPLLAGSPV